MYDIFEGVKILDLTKVLSGPFATRLFADYGAEVLKIESEDYPDPSRNFPPLKGSWSGYYEMLNRNKYSIKLNLKDKSDLYKFYGLVRKADVVVENMTPSTKHKLKIDYDTLKKINKNLIYASLSGVDQNSDRPYFDVIAQAESGLMSLTGIKEETKIGPAVVDSYAGVTLAFAICSALYKREKTGKGENLSVSMLSSAMSLLEHNLVEASVTKKNPALPGNYDSAISPFGVYSCKDKKIVLAIGNENIWKKFVNIFPKAEISASKFSTNRKRLEHLNELNDEINLIFSKYKAKDLISILDKNGIPCAYVLKMTDVLKDESHYKRRALVRVKTKHFEYVVPGSSIVFHGEKSHNARKAPKLGQDNKKYGL